MGDVGTAAGGGSSGDVGWKGGGLEGWGKVEREWLQSIRAAGQVCVRYLSLLVVYLRVLRTVVCKYEK